MMIYLETAKHFIKRSSKTIMQLRISVLIVRQMKTTVLWKNIKLWEDFWEPGTCWSHWEFYMKFNKNSKIIITLRNNHSHWSDSEICTGWFQTPSSFWQKGEEKKNVINNTPILTSLQIAIFFNKFSITDEKKVIYSALFKQPLFRLKYKST